jgi:hypothetical protein
MALASCGHVEHQCWCSPLPLWEADQERWDRFCLEINSRIMETRRRRGRDDIATFSPPIPANVEAPTLPMGRVAPLPTNQDDRDERGRFSRRSA